MSDKTNTTAALTFLKEMDERQNSSTASDHDIINDTDTDNKKKIVYRKSSALKLYMAAVESQESPDVELARPHHRGNKLIMPEYVVGVGCRKSSRPLRGGKGSHQRPAEPTNKVKLTLDHIVDDGLQDEEMDSNAFEA